VRGLGYEQLGGVRDRGEWPAAAQDVPAPILTSTVYLDEQGAMACSGSRGRGGQGTEKEDAMLWTIAVILLVLWALGMFSSYTAGGLVHLLLVIAVIVVVLQFFSGRRSI
jgi:hypothetical protein